MLRDLFHDVRFAVRTLRRQSGFAVVAGLTMGLGIAVTTTIFSLVNGILLKPLPFPDPERLVSVWPDRWFSPSLFDYVERETDSYEAIAGVTWRGHVDIGPGGATRLWGPMTTAGFFNVLDPNPILGRTFIQGEDTPGNDHVVVISHGLWQRRFGGDRDVIGMSIDLRGASRTVIGVMRPGFDFLRAGTDLVLPTVRDPESVRYHDSSYKVIARLKPGVSRTQANAELQLLATRIRDENNLPADWGMDADVVPMRDYLVGDVRPTLLLLFGAVGVLLLITAANLANLLLARALSRQREVLMRLALGASRGRLVRQMLTECTVLGLIGVILGVAGAAVGLEGVMRLLPPDTPRLAEAQVDVPVLLFSLTLALAVGWVVGLVPALRAHRTGIGEGLAGGGRTSTGGRTYLRAAIVAGEVALAVALLAGSGVLIKSFWRVHRVDPGFQAEGLLTFEMIAPPGRLGSLTEATDYFTEVSQRLGQLPGVETVSRTTRNPMAPDGNVINVRAEGRPNQSDEEGLLARWLRSTPSYFTTLGVPLLKGRLLADTDVAGGDPVAVISAQAAKRLFPGEDPLGKRIRTGFESFPVEVVGVVGDVKLLSLEQDAPLIVYRPYVQTTSVSERFGVSAQRAFLLRTSVDPGSLIGAVRRELRTFDSRALVEGLQSMEETISQSTTGRRVILILLSLFASTAVALSCVGIFGVAVYSVQQRRREISIRVALGASAPSIVRSVLAAGLRIGLFGAVAGVGLAVALSRAIDRFAFEVSGSDPAVLAGAAALATVVALVASLLPALRAIRSDPMEALAAE